MTDFYVYIQYIKIFPYLYTHTYMPIHTKKYLPAYISKLIFEICSHVRMSTIICGHSDELCTDEMLCKCSLEHTVMSLQNCAIAEGSQVMAVQH